jgi:hypothetical protein
MYGAILTLYEEPLLGSGHSRCLNLAHCHDGHVRKVRIEMESIMRTTTDPDKKMLAFPGLTLLQIRRGEPQR